MECAVGSADLDIDLILLNPLLLYGSIHFHALCKGAAELFSLVKRL